jgi:hypothetical protein
MLGAGLVAASLLSLLWPTLGDAGKLAFLGTSVRGFAIGALLAWICQRTRFARPGLAAAIAATATALSIVGAHYVEHHQDRAETIAVATELMHQRLSFGTSPGEVRIHFDETVGSLNFPDYLRSTFGLRGAGTDGASNVLGPAFGIGLASLELALALLLSMYLPAGRASEPVCAECGAWLPEEQLARARFGHTSRFLELLLGGDCEQALEELLPPDTEEYLLLSLAQCEHHPTRQCVLRLREQFFSRRGHHELMRHRIDLLLGPRERDLLKAMEPQS